MRIPYTAQITEDGSGKVLIADLECELEASFDAEDGVSIDAVHVDGVNIDRSPDGWFRRLGAIIRLEAEDDPYVLGHFSPADRLDRAASRADRLHQARMEGVA